MLKSRLTTNLLVFLFHFLPLLGWSQLLKPKSEYTRYDSLLGTISPLRNYDVTHYDIDVEVFPNTKSIRGTVDMEFITLEPMEILQLDLFSIYQVQDIKINGQLCSFKRDSNHLFIQTKNIIKSSDNYNLLIRYSGKPIAAKKAPWDGGFIWGKDSFGDWHIGVACEGLGASSWWPCKDHWSDEPDRGVDVKVTIPTPYKAVSNGKLLGTKKLGDKTQWLWAVTQPINLYDVTINIARYENFSDEYISKINGKKLSLNYWVLRENLSKAKKHFEQVRPMLDCYESKLGTYPFYEDGYQLVETPYLGMEHQSCVAYGNKYLPGYLGKMDYTGGLPFDYIIIHESGHEWFGNNITAADNADMWIHEALTTYSESIYTSCIYGEEEAHRYINKMKSRVSNKEPIQGRYGVAKEGAGDMYAKGALFFHTLRYQINNDALWYSILRDMNTHFGKKTTDYKEFVAYFNKKANLKLDNLFSVYLQYSEIPTVKVISSSTKDGQTIRCQLTHPKPFSMKFFYTVNGKESIMQLNTSQVFELKLPVGAQFSLDETKGYFKVEK